MRARRCTLHHWCGELGRGLRSGEQAWCLRQRPHIQQLDQEQDQLNISRQNCITDALRIQEMTAKFALEKEKQFIVYQR